MNDKTKLSAPQMEALNKAREAGKLVRWRGGFWTIPNCAVASYQETDRGQLAVPAWHVGTATIHALVRQGVVEVTARMSSGDPQAVTPKERATHAQPV